MLIGTLNEAYQAKVEERGWCKFNTYEGHTIFKYAGRYYVKDVTNNDMVGSFLTMKQAVFYARTHSTGLRLFHLYKF